MLFRSPSDAFFDFEHTTKVIRTRFDQVAEAREFGDLIVLGSDAGEVVHMCVHIAEDIVFTKNGADIHQPWVLMRLSDVLAKYPASQPLRFTAFRPRNNSAGSLQRFFIYLPSQRCENTAPASRSPIRARKALPTNGDFPS